MAQAETIRTQAQKAAEDYFASDDYRYLMTKFSYLNKKQRSETGDLDEDEFDSKISCTEIYLLKRLTLEQRNYINDTMI